MNKNPLASKISSALSESASEFESGAVAIEVVSLRPSANVAAMITALNEVLGQTVSTLFLDAISERLYELLLESKNNESLILGLLEDVVKVESDWPSPLSVKPSAQGSALELLVKRNAVTYDYNEYLKK